MQCRLRVSASVCLIATVVAGPVQRGVSAVVSQRGQGRWLGAGDAQQLAKPGGVASGRSQVDGGTTPRVAEQNRGFLLQQTLDTLLLTTQQLGRENIKPNQPNCCFHMF